MSSQTNENRRNFLKYAATGVGGVIVGGLAGSQLVPPKEVVKEVEKKVTSSLYEAAKAEGKMTLYGTFDTEAWQKSLYPVWQKSYPDLSVEYVGLPAVDLQSRLLAEYKTGNVIADVVSDGPGRLVTISKEGVLTGTELEMEKLMGYDLPWDNNNVLHWSTALFIGMAYNTNLVPDAKMLPNTYEELADPKWDGKMALDKPSTVIVSGTAFVSLRPVMGDKWRPWLENLAKLKIRYTDAGHDAYASVESGEQSITLAFLHDTNAGIAKGAPINFKWLDPGILYPSAVSLATNAPHPGMAKLFMNWWVSWEGQRANAASGKPPAHYGALNYYYHGTVPAGLKMVSPGQAYLENPAEFVALMKEIFGV